MKLNKSKGAMIKFLLAIFVIAGMIYFIIDYRGKRIISLRLSSFRGINCLQARELIVQEHDNYGNLWATRGMVVYRRIKGEMHFTRMAHVPTGFSVFWLRNFTVVRRLTLRPECMELTLAGDGSIIALSAGRVWYLKSGSGKWISTGKLRHYGYGDQGFRSAGLMNFNNNEVYFGEYFRNKHEGDVLVYKFNNDNLNWETAYRFPGDSIRHIHSVQYDRQDNKIWVCTGDLDRQSLIGWSDDKLKTLNILGSGSQLWRTCHLVLTEESIYWGTDTSDPEVSGIYRMDRATKELKMLRPVDGAIFYATRLKGGTIIFSTDREAMSNEISNMTSLFVVGSNDRVSEIKFGTWGIKIPGFWFKYAILRLQRDQDSEDLAVTVLNQREFSDGELLIISESELRKLTSD